MKLRHKEAIIGYAFALPSLAGFIAFFAIPFVISLYYCFTKGIGGTQYVGLENFKSLFESSSFQLAGLNTLKFIVVSVPFIIVISLYLAILLNKKVKGTSYFRTFFILPLVIPVASVILVWQILFSKNGSINGLLACLNINPVDWLNTGWSFYILVLLYVWKNCGYNIVLFLAGLNSIPKEYYESAQIDGAGKITCFFKITVPFLIPTGFFVFIISIINSFKVFREAYLLAGAYPFFDIYMLQHFMNNNFYNLNYQRLSTAAFIMLIFIVTLVITLYVSENKFEKGINS
ncbi:MAG: sugar ABC transporter permease [Eubacteriales bacterium]|nr:sugar ABC transporter permease [Eubacteriales bacterium]